MSTSNFSDFTEKLGRSAYLPIWIAAGVLLIVAELLALGWVASGQVERSNSQQAQASALRVKLWGCLDAGAGPAVDRCRADVMAGGTGSTRVTLASYVPDAPSSPDASVYSRATAPSGGMIPVSMVQGGLR